MANVSLSGQLLVGTVFGQGAYRVRGVVTWNGAPASMWVTLYKGTGMVPIASVLSAADGSYAFNNLAAGNYLVFSRDPSGTYNAIVHDHITAEPMPAPV